MNEISIKRKLFLFYYAKLQNVKESAIKAGYFPPTAMVEGMKILKMRSSQSFLKKLRSSACNSVKDLTLGGLERIAFGEINDAVKLVFSEDEISTKEIEELNLFNISEIKKDKGGGVEIKVFDRIKALEALSRISDGDESDSTAKSLFTAIEKGAENLTVRDADDEV